MFLRFLVPQADKVYDMRIKHSSQMACTASTLAIEQRSPGLIFPATLMMSKVSRVHKTMRDDNLLTVVPCNAGLDKKVPEVWSDVCP